MPEGIHGVEGLSGPRNGVDLSAWLELMPYARRIGVSALSDPEGESLLFRLEPRPGNVGNIMLPALHGGVVAAFMETAATLELMLATREPRLPKVVDVSVDYLRTARLVPTHARCSLLREGRRLANVTVSAWQKEETAPVATARLHFVLGDLGNDPA
ncbi:MAG: PaaI family thioesterase [Halomonas sp.]|uniref:PaaI family thioesterase n=1 Tax=Halomonas sp. TaxID=1486246 RepID=UPI00178DFE07|nr:PaaI family thioesterase [Halomonas sp.]NWN83208.1 PaaI family thioesterase [Halomonas sp.]